MLLNADIRPGAAFSYKGGKVFYVGRSREGGFVVQLSDTRDKHQTPVNHFVVAQPFELARWGV